MIFIDESGDDGTTEKSSQRFFVVTALFSDLNLAQKENMEIRKILKFTKVEMKWNKLTKKQKEIFLNYCKKISYKIDYIYLDKDVNQKQIKYYDLAKDIIERNKMFLSNEILVYKGEHLKKMFERIRRELNIQGIKLKHREIILAENCGIEIADLWAGYLHNKLKVVN